MKALAIHPRVPDSGSLIDVPRPRRESSGLLCEMIAVGICGTDRELLRGDYGDAPDGDEYLIIGHESLGRVIESGDPGFQPGDLVAGIVRRPDPVPCPSCAAGEWDMCQNGLYTERGIHKRHGYASEFFTLDASYAVKVDPALGESGVLMEPCSIVAKAWEQIERIAARSTFRPRKVLITGAGPVGLLAALIATQKKYDVHVLDRAAEGPKPLLVAELGATYHSREEELESFPRGFDITIECTGAPALVARLVRAIAPDGILCLTGVSSGGRRIPLDVGALNREIVLENEVIFGSVNANRRHFAMAAEVLANADPTWLRRLITRRVTLTDWPSALRTEQDDIKVVLTSAVAP